MDVLTNFIVVIISQYIEYQIITLYTLNFVICQSYHKAVKKGGGETEEGKAFHISHRKFRRENLENLAHQPVSE